LQQRLNKERGLSKRNDFNLNRTAALAELRGLFAIEASRKVAATLALARDAEQQK